MLPFKKKFTGLFWTQFWGALNDNYFKNSLVILMTFKHHDIWGLSTGSLVALAGGVFISPFFFFSGYAGQFTDKFEKATVARLIKWMEVAVMTLASIGFYFELYSALLLVLFFMGLHSTLFGPAKYALIPELVEPKELTSANAWVESGTFLAILIGTILGGFAASSANATLWAIGGVLGFAVVGLAFSYLIPPVGAADSGHTIKFNFFKDLKDTLNYARRDGLVFQSILGISWFWMLGSIILSILPVYVHDQLSADEHVVTLFLALFTVGIGTGALICGLLSEKLKAVVLVAVGALGMTVALADWSYVTSLWALPYKSFSPISVGLFLEQNYSLRILIDLFAIAFFGGIFTVPLYTWMQKYSERAVRSRVVAANNILSSAFIVAGALFLMGCYSLNLGFTKILLILAGLNFLVAVIYHFTLRPIAKE